MRIILSILSSQLGVNFMVDNHVAVFSSYTEVIRVWLVTEIWSLLVLRHKFRYIFMSVTVINLSIHM